VRSSSATETTQPSIARIHAGSMFEGFAETGTLAGARALAARIDGYQRAWSVSITFRKGEKQHSTKSGLL